MHTHIRQLMLLTGFALTVSGAAHADNDDHRKGCSEATLKGLYTFTASGFTIVGGAALPKAVVQFTRFEGEGKFTVPEGTLSSNGVISQILWASGLSLHVRD